MPTTTSIRPPLALAGDSKDCCRLYAAAGSWDWWDWRLQAEVFAGAVAPVGLATTPPTASARSPVERCRFAADWFDAVLFSEPAERDVESPPEPKGSADVGARWSSTALALGSGAGMPPRDAEELSPPIMADAT